MGFIAAAAPPATAAAATATATAARTVGGRSRGAPSRFAAPPCSSASTRALRVLATARQGDARAGETGAVNGAGAASPRSVAAWSTLASNGEWFELRKRVMPRETDYSGVAWHGSYVGWLEEARVAMLAAKGLQYDRLVAEDACEMPVTHMELAYKWPARLGDVVRVQLRATAGRGQRQNGHGSGPPPPSSSSSLAFGPRLVFDCRVVSDDEATIYLTAAVTLVIRCMRSGRPMRRPPARLQAALDKRI